MSLTIVIPSYNEAESLTEVLSELTCFAKENRFKIIMVNDGSKDNTQQIIAGFINESVITLRHKINRGYGAAIKTGIKAATTTYVITVDADGQHRKEDILKLYNEIRKTDADLIVGGRLDQKDSALMRGMGKSVIRFLVRLLIRVQVHDINSGMKIYRTDLAQKYLRLAPNSMAFSDVMTITFVHFGKYVLEVPIKINKRISGKSTINYKTGLNTLTEVLFIATVFAPYKFFTMISMIIFVVSLGWGLSFILAGKGFTTATIGGVLVAVLLWSLGVIAQLISGIRKDLIENTN